MTKTARQLQAEGALYDVFDQELANIKDKNLGLVSKLARTSSLDKEEVLRLVRAIVAKLGENSYVVPPFRCDYGYNVFIGKNSYINYNCCFLDSGKVTIGDYVYMGPNCNIFTPCHPIHHELRTNEITEYALPITVGSHTWICGDVVIAPGVTIGENCVIGAGSVVTKDIPDNSFAAGNPCKVIRNITEADKQTVANLTLDDDTKDNIYKQEHGYMYYVMDKALRQKAAETIEKVHILNKLSNSELYRRQNFLATFIPDFGKNVTIQSPFYMEFGDHLAIGDNSFINYDCIMLNSGKITIGKNVLIGPKVSFYTPIHPFVASQREEWIEHAEPITIEDDVWIGGSVTLVGGITIGKNSIIGAGSVVIHDVPANSVVVGNPAKVIRTLTDADSKKYFEELAMQPKDLSEHAKMLKQYWYNAMSADMVKLRQDTNKKTETYSRISENTLQYKDKLAKAMFKSFDKEANLIPPFTCDYGTTVSVGEYTVINNSGVFVDTNEINIGKHALIGPKSGLYCAIHPFDTKARAEGMEKSKPITIGDGAWLGGKVTVLPGVNIGKHSVIGAGSVVVKDIPDDVVAVGNPCKPIRNITDEDKLKPIRHHKK